MGILSSGSLQQSQIARALREPCRLHHTQKRLSRMLASHSEVTWAAEQLQLQKLGPKVNSGMILAIDPGDLNRDGSPKSEHRGWVRDGDRGEQVGGYPLMSVVARDVERGVSLPLITRLLSSNRPAHRSENTDILAVMDEVRRHVPAEALWVIDRGGDRGVLWNAWLEGGYQMLVRAANLRYWLWRGGHGTAQQIARQLPLRHWGRMRPHAQQSVRFGITRVNLREHPDTPLWMIVVRHGKRQPLVLVTNRPVRRRRQGEWMIQNYLDRWACEEGYRFSKQGFDLERVTARRFTSLQNLVALASLAWALLAAYQDDGQYLLNRARRQKRKPPRFVFYSLLMGWQQLFAGAREIFHGWWRRPPKPHNDDPPPIPDLFAGSASLVPAGG
ncbi:transposase [Wenzhouxiangella limi]|uniref:Transposase n=1 Tax=Wenzhouxiangella limi TaxID=2707351 RepID=A0A845V301_9GAMM|nr:transposase [Wenzhouxiangella limi]